MTNTGLPKRVYVAGMPLAWRGFNGWYTYNPDHNVYRRDSPSYWGLGILPSALMYKNGEWRIDAYGLGSFLVARARDLSADSPVGDWGSSGILVAENPSVWTWWRSNSTIITIVTGIALCGYFWRGVA